MTLPGSPARAGMDLLIPIAVSFLLRLPRLLLPPLPLPRASLRDFPFP
jgi:hypothetical protein